MNEFFFLLLSSTAYIVRRGLVKRVVKNGPFNLLYNPLITYGHTVYLFHSTKGSFYPVSKIISRLFMVS